MSPGLFKYERDPAPGDHDGPHHPQHQHLQGGQGQDQEARRLHNQPQVGEIVKYLLMKCFFCRQVYWNYKNELDRV